MVMVGAVMLAYNWILALVAFAVAAPLALVLRVVQRHLVAAYDTARERNGEMLSAVTEVVSGAATMQAYDAGEALGATAAGAVEQRQESQIRAQIIGAFLFPSGEVFSVLTIAAVIVVGVALGPASGLTAGAMVGFVFLTYRFLEPIAEFTEVLDQTQTAVAGLRRVLGVLDLPVGPPPPTDPRPLPPARSTSTSARSRSRTRRAAWPRRSTQPCCATSRCTSRPASRSRWSAPPGPARRRWGA